MDNRVLGWISSSNWPTVIPRPSVALRVDDEPHDARSTSQNQSSHDDTGHECRVPGSIGVEDECEHHGDRGHGNQESHDRQWDDTADQVTADAQLARAVATGEHS